MKASRIITTAFIAPASLAANAQEGAWNGELNVMGTKLPLVFTFSTEGCTMDSPSQGAKGIPAEKTIKDDGTIKITVAMIEQHLRERWTTTKLKVPSSKMVFKYLLP